MATITFARLSVGQRYGRDELTRIWNYRGVEALNRGVVTSRGQPFVVLFVTRDKQSGYEPYENRLEGNRLFWEGPTNHYAEDRMIDAGRTSDEIHLFFRDKHHSEFTYLGQVELEDVIKRAELPSQFTLRLLAANAGTYSPD